ncbi:uncharacterized protein LOC119661065 [Hermetia illucens]|uniref:uncharacterized protein LOC119661065 n=1 Tax=Hermetia illucens TaxID=343691 RepID=UPI0018CC6A7A|nr:uncharacterized protein LOC119661065 [Hermetia illucens]
MNAKTIGARRKVAHAICVLSGLRTQMKLRRPVWFDHSSSNLCPVRRTVKWEDVQSAFKSRIRTGVITNLENKDPANFLHACASLFRRRITRILKSEIALKVNAELCGEFKIVKGEDEHYEFKCMNTRNMPIYQDTDINIWFKRNIQDKILQKLEEFEEKDSGWTLSAIINLSININKFAPMQGSSYIQLPKEISDKKACINVKNDDNACFAWAVVSALHSVRRLEHPDRPASYPHYSHVLNLKDIRFPITVKQIPRFEKQNNLSINVYILQKTGDGKKVNYIVLPTYLTKAKKIQHVNLLMVQSEYYNDEDVNDSDINRVECLHYHFVWIKNLSRLLSSQVSQHKSKILFCERCLHYFYSPTRLEKHIQDCNKLNNCKIRLPSEDSMFLKFKNFSNKVEIPFVIYADLECLLIPINDKNKYQEHIPSNVGYYVKCSYDQNLSFYKSYRGKDCIKWFINELKQIAEYLQSIFLSPVPLTELTIEETSNFKNACKCHICEKLFSMNDIKVQDHCHLTGKYRGAAHNACNINFKDSHTIPVIFHNLSGYDSHFIIENLASGLRGRIDLLPINKERYISFTKYLEGYLIKFRFIDSFRFMANSLDTLASYLTMFPILKSQFTDLTEDKFNLITRKLLYPYDYFNSFDKFTETAIPDFPQFYNKLNDESVSHKDYVHTSRIWEEFSIKNLGEYSDLYLKIDVLLLADVFEEFRSNCHNTYGLDPAHYFTLPGYTWDAMLKCTDVTLELLIDVDMLMFFERGIRGGLSQCSKRYSKANNKYMCNYDSTKPSKFLIYNDINNQYGWAMCQFLPQNSFEWLENTADFKVEDVSDESPIGYILEVDLEYPKELHNLHNQLPFCSERSVPPGSKEEKLLATLKDKVKYIIHYRNLKQAMEHGLNLTKIHRVLSFRQSPWLKPYIELNTRLRTLSKNDFEKHLFKLMNNAVFGKTMENVRKHSIVKLVTQWSGRYGAESLIAKPEFKASTVFNENLVAIELNKSEIYFNKPIYVGMCILDLAKTTIYDFHYNYMIPEFGFNCSLCYTDTDSLIYEIECYDFYEVIKRDCRNRFDTSDYPSNNIFGIPLVNKKVLGLMKDENNGKIMTEFVGLRSKMYAIRVAGEDKMKKSKGVKSQIVKNRLSFDDFVDCLKNNTRKEVKQNLIQSQKHKVSSVRQLKIALSANDDKRYIIKDTFETLAWGHHSIMDVDISDNVANKEIL